MFIGCQAWVILNRKIRATLLEFPVRLRLLAMRSLLFPCYIWPLVDELKILV
jgi:hypothetical protein